MYIPSSEAVRRVVAAEEDKSYVKNVTFYVKLVKCDEFGTLPRLPNECDIM
jgi:hypothetical protein